MVCNSILVQIIVLSVCSSLPVPDIVKVPNNMLGEHQHQTLKDQTSKLTCVVHSTQNIPRTYSTAKSSLSVQYKGAPVSLQECEDQASQATDNFAYCSITLWATVLHYSTASTSAVLP